VKRPKAAPANPPVPANATARSSSALGYAQQVAADFALWLGLVIVFQAFRGVLFWWFREQAGSHVTFNNLQRCFQAGLRYDISNASYLCLPLMLMAGLGCVWFAPKLHARMRMGVTSIAAALCAILLPVDVAYFQEYHNQFDHWIWGVVFDDRRAIALTIWKSYPVVWLTLGALLLGVALGVGLRWWTRWVGRMTPDWAGLARGWRRGVAFLLLVAVFVFGARGSLGKRPVQRKDAAVAGDIFLDKLVPNPITALRHSIEDHQLLSKAMGLEVILPGGDIGAAARTAKPDAAPGATVDDLIRRTAAGTSAPRPKHIFLLVLESYDSWAMQPKFAALHLTDRVKALGRAGIQADAFVSAGGGTMPSLAALITGLPEVRVHPNYRDTIRAGVATAAAPLFKRLGYRTRFFYAGYLSWQRLGDFCAEQGFDEVHGGAMMVQRLTGNEWGVDDEDLFRYIVDRTGDEPTFNLVMTTSYHPPFSVDVAAKGFSLRQLPPELGSYQATPAELNILGHLWYSDRCAGDFAEELLRRQPLSLVAITGDHWSRRCLEKRTSIFERHAVPLVLFGPAVLTNAPRPAQIAGSHNDILPTLVELAAPTGFVYHAFGRNLLDPAQPQVGYGSGTVVTPEYTLEIDPPAGPELLPGGTLPSPEREAELRLRYRQLHALAWWRIIKGNELPSAVAATPPSPPPGPTDQAHR
jgi:phosphoglycerol transferase MdoB-like AlkP superfamily enzyme